MGLISGLLESGESGSKNLSFLAVVALTSVCASSRGHAPSLRGLPLCIQGEGEKTQKRGHMNMSVAHKRSGREQGPSHLCRCLGNKLCLCLRLLFGG